jgi:serine protease Do
MIRRSLIVACLFFVPAFLQAQAPLSEVAKEANQKMVKLYGSGGYRGLPAYGSGMLISNKGHILTIANHILDTQDLRVHLWDGRKLRAKVVVIEPALDAAILKIDTGGNPEAEKELDLPFFDAVASSKMPLAPPGTWIMALSNEYEVASRDEPMSVQHGTIASFTKLHGRRGIFDASYTGEVYVTEAIICNPGAAGGAIVNRKGDLLGIIGKELRNTLSETWINYAVPMNAKVEVREGEQAKKITMEDFVTLGPAGKWNPTKIEKPKEGPGGYHGIVLVPNVVERTPPFVDGVRPGSPAEKAGLLPDDLIVYVEGEPVVSIKSFHDLIARTRPGETIKIEVRRGDKLMAVDLKLEEVPKPKK